MAMPPGVVLANGAEPASNGANVRLGVAIMPIAVGPKTVSAPSYTYTFDFASTAMWPNAVSEALEKFRTAGPLGDENTRTSGVPDGEWRTKIPPSAVTATPLGWLSPAVSAWCALSVGLVIMVVPFKAV